MDESNKVSLRSFKVLKRPLVTEKSAGGLGERTFSFEIDSRATKNDVRRAVAALFNVKVESVRTLSILGKIKRTARGSTRRAGIKKAYVTLVPGERLELVEGI
jgi:large subunit ribosomal protein L23